MITVSYTALHTDDYRSGPRLYLLDVNDMEEREDNWNSAEIELEMDENYRVYLLWFQDNGENSLEFRGIFDTKEKADEYCERQFILRNRIAPFRSNVATTSSWHPEGTRAELPDNWNDNMDEEDEVGDDDDGERYLIVVSTKLHHPYSFSLHLQSVW